MRIAAALCRMVALPLTAQSIFLGVATGQSRALKGDISGVESIVFAADSSLLATVGFDGRVKVWDVAPGAEFEILKQTRMDTSCAQFSPDGK